MYLLRTFIVLTLLSLVASCSATDVKESDVPEVQSDLRLEIFGMD